MSGEIKHIDCVVLDTIDQETITRLGLTKLILNAFPIADIAQHDCKRRLPAVNQLDDRCFSGKLAAILSAAKDLAVLTHRTRLCLFCCGSKVTRMAPMQLYNAMRNEDIERLTNRLMYRVAKNLSSALIKHYDPLRCIDCDNCVARQSDYAFKR